jgi:hypothetical protein
MNSKLDDNKIEQNATNYVDTFFKSFNKSAYANLSGVRPYSREEANYTTSRNFNKDMDKVVNDKEYRENFYKEMKGK